MKVEIKNLQTEKINLEAARKIVEFILTNEKTPDGTSLSVSFVDNKTIREYNEKYMNRDNVTDVLSFSMKEGEVIEGDNSYLGDVLVSVEMAFLRAEEFANEVDRELMLYFIHGILHLLGYEDIDTGSALVMREKEEQICIELWDKQRWRLLIR
ncbi:MAG: rRNA maturation RNase YbeY [Candidatus Aureabacteria bacterium]|nr:rRNA maturation RNase YbeY [Candidatus Auribacterota bacterium]MCK5161036.1 rRNA maturation RNase YbeY [Candidatus Auribacterota bacterium]